MFMLAVFTALSSVELKINAGQHNSTANSPYRALIATLERASALRSTTSGAVTVHVHGHFNLQAPISGALGGPGGAALRLKGPATFSGGVAVTGWQQDATRPWLWQAPVPAGLTLAHGTISQLWDGGRRVQLARSPTMQYNRTCAIDTTTLTTKCVFANPGQLPEQFSDMSTLRLIMYHSWDASYHPVAAIDHATGQISTTNLLGTRFNGNCNDGPDQCTGAGHNR